MRKTFVLLCASIVALSACSKKETVTEAPATKSLVLYYSQTNATKQVAQFIQQQTGADIEEIKPVQAYDGDFQQTIARCQQEMATDSLPALSALTKQVADYDTIYLGYPVWFGTYALPVASLLKTENFAGKVLIPFCTFGSGGLNTSSDQLKNIAPNANHLPGYGIRNARIAQAEAEVKQFLINSGIVAGEKVVLPEFSEQAAISEADKQIFDAACGSYMMPLGNPVSVGSRSLSNGVEYLFTVDANGNSAQIYVTAIEGQTPEFTQVVR